MGCWGTSLTQIGAAGDGHKMKLIMNFLSLGYAALYAEALTVAQKVGLSPHTVDSVVRGSRMDCGVYQTYFRWVLERDREAHQFTLKNAHKDMQYLIAMADAAGVVHPLGAAVRNAFATAEASGHGSDFVPMLSDIIAAMNGVSLT
jgi:3-hydroxyisobutyrate dehydrogenase-like beta-hydroxyacid dehydrogenase